jgi:hypothetical protein
MTKAVIRTLPNLCQGKITNVTPQNAPLTVLLSIYADNVRASYAYMEHCLNAKSVHHCLHADGAHHEKARIQFCLCMQSRLCWANAHLLGDKVHQSLLADSVYHCTYTVSQSPPLSSLCMQTVLGNVYLKQVPSNAPKCRQHPLQPACSLRPPLYTYIRTQPITAYSCRPECDTAYIYHIFI